MKASRLRSGLYRMGCGQHSSGGLALVCHLNAKDICLLITKATKN